MNCFDIRKSFPVLLIESLMFYGDAITMAINKNAKFTVYNSHFVRRDWI